MDILDLPGWRLLEAPLDAEGYRLAAEFLAEPEACQRCGVIGRLYDKRVFKGAAHIRPIAPSDEPLDMLMVCSTCDARFHTD